MHALNASSWILVDSRTLWLQLSVKQLQFENGKMIKASKYGQEEEDVAIELTDEEKAIEAKILVGIQLFYAFEAVEKKCKIFSF